jgi:hypothetical protein
MVSERAVQQVAPIFRLLGDGHLEPEAVDALIAALEAEGLPRLSPVACARAYRLAERPRRTGPLTALRRLVATLVYDTRRQALPAGIRGAGTGRHRLLFTVDQYEVMVNEAVGAQAGQRAVMGQVLWRGDPLPQATVVLSGTGWQAQIAAETDVDEEGCFRFPAIARGSYQLDVYVPNDLIVCTPVAIG